MDIQERRKELSKADEMFKKLGYKINNLSNSHIIQYKIDRDNEFHFVYIRIDFYKRLKNINIDGTISMEELQAINEKVKELGWNEN